MIFTQTDLAGAFVIEPETHEDARGFFARTWCQREFASHGLNAHLAQCSVSFSHSRGTLRGIHYQTAPREEAKLVRCTKGSIYDVIIDLRADSATFTRSFTVELTANNRRMLYVPEGIAHGFQTLEDNTEVFYQISEFYTPEYARGIRWNDPLFGIRWPLDLRMISDKDQSYPDFAPSDGAQGRLIT
jgi:dTDP-4-dehydrorhamnose 3,5-epimerase